MQNRQACSTTLKKMGQKRLSFIDEIDQYLGQCATG